MLHPRGFQTAVSTRPKFQHQNLTRPKTEKILTKAYHIISYHISAILFIHNGDKFGGISEFSVASRKATDSGVCSCCAVTGNSTLPLVLLTRSRPTRCETQHSLGTRPLSFFCVNFLTLPIYPCITSF